MNGEIKIIESVYPVTVLEAVKVGDGTDKTLKDMIDNNELGGGTQVTTNGRGEAIFLLRGATVYIETVMSNGVDAGVKYYFPNGDTDRLRRLFVKTPSGGMSTIDLQDGILLTHEGIVYNITNNTIEKRSGTWGNIACSNNEYVLLYNCLGYISGELSSYVKYKYEQQDIPIIDLDFEQISSSGSTQGIVAIDGQIYTTYHASDDHSLFDGNIGGKPHNICHMNAPYYNSVKDMFIVGNGSKSYELPMMGWIFPNWKSTFNTQTQLDFNTLEKIELDFTQFQGEYKPQLVWADDNTDVLYLLTCDNRIVRKIQLNKVGDTYDGTYIVLGTWYSRVSDIMGGMIFYKGCLYTGVKGSYGIRKMKFCVNGNIISEYIHPNNKIGDMQGLAISDGFLYAYTDSKGYKISLNEL